MPEQRDNAIQYSPLRRKNEIRLVRLEPGAGDDIVKCYMEHRELRSARNEFEAVSYVWGNLDERATIMVDNSYISVTKSLEAALRSLRHQGYPRTLWIDYICINQCDTEERNCQVAKMGLIYEFAKTVLIWLGEATHDTAVGFEILDYFVNQPRPQFRPIWQDYPSSAVQAGLLDIMSRTWFQRIWVVQEVGRSGTAALICGRYEVKWQSSDCTEVRRLMRMIKYAEMLPQWKQMGLGTVNMSPLLDMLDIQIGNQLDRSSGSTHRMAPDLLDIAHGMRHKSCTDPRDKLFGILGLVQDMWDLEFTPDYNMTVGQTYEALAIQAFG